MFAGPNKTPAAALTSCFGVSKRRRLVISAILRHRLRFRRSKTLGGLEHPRRFRQMRQTASGGDTEAGTFQGRRRGLAFKWLHICGLRLAL